MTIKNRSPIWGQKVVFKRLKILLPLCSKNNNQASRLNVENLYSRIKNTIYNNFVLLDGNRESLLLDESRVCTYNDLIDVLNYTLFSMHYSLPFNPESEENFFSVDIIKKLFKNILFEDEKGLTNLAFKKHPFLSSIDINSLSDRETLFRDTFVFHYTFLLRRAWRGCFYNGIDVDFASTRSLLNYYFRRKSYALLENEEIIQLITKFTTLSVTDETTKSGTIQFKKKNPKEDEKNDIEFTSRV